MDITMILMVKQFVGMCQGRRILWRGSVKGAISHWQIGLARMGGLLTDLLLKPVKPLIGFHGRLYIHEQTVTPPNSLLGVVVSQA